MEYSILLISTFYRRIWGRAAGLHIHPHQLRHNYASMLCRRAWTYSYCKTLLFIHRAQLQVITWSLNLGRAVLCPWLEQCAVGINLSFLCIKNSKNPDRNETLRNQTLRNQTLRNQTLRNQTLQMMKKVERGWMD